MENYGEGSIMNKKIFLMFIVSLLFTVSFITTVNAQQTNAQGIRDILCERKEDGGGWDCSIDIKHDIDMYGTEYYITQDTGKIWLQLLRDETPIDNAICRLTMYNPDTSYFIEEGMMMEVEEGIYNYDFPIDEQMDTGVYMARAECEYEVETKHEHTEEFGVITGVNDLGNHTSTHKTDGVYHQITTYGLGQYTGNSWSVISNAHSQEYKPEENEYTIMTRDRMYRYDSDYELIEEIDIDFPSSQSRSHEYVGDYLYILSRAGLVWQYDENYETTGVTYDLANKHDVSVMRDLEYMYGHFYTVDRELEVVRKYDDDFNLLQTWDVSGYSDNPTDVGDVETEECQELCAWVIDEDGTFYRMNLDGFDDYNMSIDLTDVLSGSARDLVWDTLVDYFHLLDSDGYSHELGHGCQQHNCIYYEFNADRYMELDYVYFNWIGHLEDCCAVFSLWNFEEQKWEELPNVATESSKDYLVSNRIYLEEEYIDENNNIRIGIKTIEGLALNIFTNYMSLKGVSFVEEPIIYLRGSAEAHIKEPLHTTNIEQIASEVLDEYRKRDAKGILTHDLSIYDKEIEQTFRFIYILFIIIVIMLGFILLRVI